MVSDEVRRAVRRAMAKGLSTEREIARSEGLSKTAVHRALIELDREMADSHRTRVRAGAGARSEGGPSEDDSEGADQSGNETERSTPPSVEEPGPSGSGPTPPPSPGEPQPGTTRTRHSPAGRSSKREADDSDQSEPADNRDPKDIEIERLSQELRGYKGRVSVLNRMLMSEAQAGSQQGMAGEEIAGRPSLAAFRKTWKSFAVNVMDLPKLAIQHGRSRAAEIASATLVPDLMSLVLSDPRNDRASYLRESVFHFVTDDAKLNIMLGNDEAGVRMRTLFLRVVARQVYTPSNIRLFERAVENLMPPGMMEAMGQG